jgi:signal transduction histidine kinase
MTPEIATSTPSPDDQPPHVVQFYESDDLLEGAVVDFLADGLAADAPIIVIATETHRRAFIAQLIRRGFDPGPRMAGDRLIMLDAQETLDQFMVAAAPDWERFTATIRPVIERARAQGGGREIRAYGEMVDLLWRGGNRSGAVALEEMWNELRKLRSFSLFCSYVVSGFNKENSGVREICRTHTHVRPVLDRQHPDRSAENVRALAAEIGHRKELERELRSSVRELRAREQQLEAHLADMKRGGIERERRTRRTERLAKITSAIADAVTAEQVFEAVVDQTRSALQASSAALWLTGGSQAVARLVRTDGYGEEAAQQFATIPLESDPCPTPIVEAIRDRQLIWIASRDELIARYPNLAASVTPGRDYGVVCLPVMTSGQTLGAIGLTFEDARTLDDEEANFLLLIARYCGQALERLRLLAVEQQHRVRAELLYKLAAAVISARTVEEIFDAALDAIARALGTDRASVLLFDADRVMRFRAWRNLSDPYRTAVEGHSPWPAGARDPQPIVSSDVEADPAMASYLPLFRTERIGALAFIPLVGGGRLIGKFMVYYTHPRELTAQELELARAIANHVAAAVLRFRSLAELQQTVHLNETFAGILGHDLRNPLAAIITSARLAMKRAENDRLEKPLSRILSSGDRMTRMIDQLLDFTRVRLSGGIPIVPTEFDLFPVVRQVMDELDEANPGWALRSTSLGDTLGNWDQDRLSQLFSNLVANAVQHGDATGGVAVTIDGRAADRVQVAVHNQGVIPADRIATLFEPMASRQMQRTTGLGLGLFISRELVRGHGGSIDVRSDESAGTTFTVVLPRGCRNNAASETDSGAADETALAPART